MSRCTAHEDGTGASIRSAPRPRAPTASGGAPRRRPAGQDREPPPVANSVPGRIWPQPPSGQGATPVRNPAVLLRERAGARRDRQKKPPRRERAAVHQRPTNSCTVKPTSRAIQRSRIGDKCRPRMHRHRRGAAVRMPEALVRAALADLLEAGCGENGDDLARRGGKPLQLGLPPAFDGLHRRVLARNPAVPGHSSPGRMAGRARLLTCALCQSAGRPSAGRSRPRPSRGILEASTGSSFCYRRVADTDRCRSPARTKDDPRLARLIDANDVYEMMRPHRSRGLLPREIGGGREA